ncbi:HAMP domain-containing histidine kinase [bacterium]|nr:HAMP domain-containing histidine kinase [bacterium]
MFRSSNSSRSGLAGRTVIITLTVVLLILLGVIHFKWWPWLIKQPKIQFEMVEWGHQSHISMIIEEALLSLYNEHVQNILNAEQFCQNGISKEEILKNLIKLPGVKDAVYLDFQSDSSFTGKNTLDVNGLRNFIEKTRQSGGGASRFMRRRLGGLIRFYNYKDDTRAYPVIIRYLNNYYPKYAEDAIGLVMNANWLEKQIPTVLDSLAINHPSFLFFEPCPTDTQRIFSEDPWACPAGTWKITFGMTKDKTDTLYWFGEPNKSNKKIIGMEPHTKNLPGHNVEYYVNTEFMIDAEEIFTGSRTVTYIFITLEILGVLLLIIIVISIYLTKKQSHRNQIALAHLAHAIKTPVARIRLDTDSLLEEMVASPDEEREIINAISRECGRMERAVQSAALSLEKGKRTLNLESCDLAELVTNTARAWQPQFNQVGIKFEIKTTDEALSGRFDTEMIAIMIDNLVDNALRHTMLNLEKIEQSAVVSVKLKKSGEKAVITIDDMGGGIPKAERKQIFKRFQRVRGDAASGVSGLGLGLALVNEIAEAHDGNVTVEDNDFGGARFSVELPL